MVVAWGMKKLLLLSLSAALIQTGCVGIYGKSSTYAGRGAEVNGQPMSEWEEEGWDR